MWIILIPVTEPESLACYSGKIPDQVRDEGNQVRDEGNKGRQNNPATPLGFTILPNTTGVHTPPMFCRPYRANHDSAFYITGVHTPAYVLSPLQGYIIFHFPFFIFHF